MSCGAYFHVQRYWIRGSCRRHCTGCEDSQCCGTLSFVWCFIEYCTVRQIQASKSRAGVRDFQVTIYHEEERSRTIFLSYQKSLTFWWKQVAKFYELTCCNDKDELVKGAQETELRLCRHIQDSISEDEGIRYSVPAWAIVLWTVLSGKHSKSIRTIQYLVANKIHMQRFDSC